MRRAKALFFSGCESRPVTFVPTGSNWSSRGGNESTEASGEEGPFFSGGSGGYTDSKYPVLGVCQVCHTKTMYWTNNGSKTGGGHGGDNCTECHQATNGFPIPVPLPPSPPLVCPGDIDRDSDVDGGDFALLSKEIGPIDCAPVCSGDFNGDGAVNQADMEKFIKSFGEESCSAE